MKHQWLILSAIALGAGPARAQTPATPKATTTAPAAKVYTYVEEMPQTPGGGGNAAIVAAIQKGVHIPPLHGNYPEHSRVMVGFIVTEAGNVRDVRIRQGIDSRIDSAVVNAVRALPRFTPGRQQGRPASVRFTVPITFHWQ